MLSNYNGEFDIYQKIQNLDDYKFQILTYEYEKIYSRHMKLKINFPGFLNI